MAGWKVIVGQTTAAFKQALLKSIPKYNGETGEPVLYVEFQTPLGRNYPDDSDACRELKEIIERQTGKECGASYAGGGRSSADQSFKNHGRSGDQGKYPYGRDH